ncbi:MAG: hypothetical protein K5981_08235, partial [Clostridia bacterium]|nr:hypothetical protein [Clostridia bacterium]
MEKKGRASLIAVLALIIAFIMAAPVYGSDAIATASGASPATGTEAIDLDLQIESIYRPDMFGQIRLGEYTVRAYRP